MLQRSLGWWPAHRYGLWAKCSSHSHALRVSLHTFFFGGGVLGLSTSVLISRSPWCLASRFQTLFNCAVAVGAIAEGLTQANWRGLWKCSLSFVCWPHAVSSTTGSWPQPTPSPPAPGRSRPRPHGMAPFPFECLLFQGLRSPFLCCWANQIDSNLLFRRGGVLIFNIMHVTVLVCFISFCCDSPSPTSRSSARE